MATTRIRQKSAAKGFKKSNPASSPRSSMASTPAVFENLHRDVGNRGFNRLLAIYDPGTINQNINHPAALQFVVQRQGKNPGETTPTNSQQDDRNSRRIEEVNAKAPQMQKEADAYYKSGEYDKAFNIYHDMWIYHNDIEVTSTSSYNMAMCFLKMENYQKAIEFYKGYLEWSGANKSLARYQIKRARKALKAEERDMIKQQWEEPEQAKQSQDVVSNDEKIFKEGEEYYKQGKYDDALNKYALLWSFHNRKSVKYSCAYNMGLCYLKMQNYEKALSLIKDYLSWEDADKSRGNRQIRRIIKLIKAEENDLIKQQWENPEQAKQSQDVIKNDVRIHDEGDSLYKQKNYEEALNKYTLLWAFHNRKSVQYPSAYNMGMCYLKMKNHEKAISFFKEYLLWEGADKARGMRQIRRCRVAINTVK